MIRLSAGPSPLSSPTRRFAAPWRGPLSGRPGGAGGRGQGRLVYGPRRLRLRGGRLDGGIVITKHGHAQGPIGSLLIREAGHPVPDQDTFSATEEALALRTA